MKILRGWFRLRGYRSREEIELDEDMLLKRLADYTCIASAEECRDAVERMRPKAVVCRRFSGTHAGCVIYKCPSCGTAIWDKAGHCKECGQALDWTEVHG